MGQRTDTKDDWESTVSNQWGWTLPEMDSSKVDSNKRRKIWWLREMLFHRIKGEIKQTCFRGVSWGGGTGGTSECQVGNMKQLCRDLSHTITDAESGPGASNSMLHGTLVCWSLSSESCHQKSGFHWMISLLLSNDVPIVFIFSLLQKAYQMSLKEMMDSRKTRTIDERNVQKLASTLSGLEFTVHPKGWFAS